MRNSETTKAGFEGCGICGYFRFGKGERKIEIDNMVEKLKHRGPDGNGTWKSSSQDVMFGHTRLSILDLSSLGAQPMTRGNVTITYNGEIYNFHDIKEELEALGYEFTSGTDTEVLLQAYAQWGEEAIKKANGFFSFAIWDESKKELFLAIDRLGIKPLYYYKDNEAFLFSSEVESLMSSNYIAPEIDWRNLMQHVSTPVFADLNTTPIKGVFAAPPGHCMRVKLDGTVTIQKYWDIPFSDPELEKMTFQEQVDKFHDLFDQSVKYRYIISDVPVACFLSGGLDSSLAAAISAKYTKEGSKIKCFTIKHDEDDCEDLKYSRIVAESLGKAVELVEVPARPQKITLDILSEITDLSTLIDDTRQLSIYENYKAVKSHGFKVVLNSQGADELMGGYVGLSSFYTHVYDVTTDTTFKQALLDLPFTGIKQYLTDFIEPEEVKRDYMKRYKEETGKAQGFEAFSRWSVKTSLRRFLRYEDFLSMRNSVEARVPYLDHKLVEFLFTVPFHKHYNAKDRIGKLELRGVVAKYLPESVAIRPKQPFPTPKYNSIHDDLVVLVNAHVKEIVDCELVKKIFRVENLESDLPELKNWPWSILWELVTFWIYYEKLNQYGPDKIKK